MQSFHLFLFNFGGLSFGRTMQGYAVGETELGGEWDWDA